MAKLIRHITGKVSTKLVISREEIRAMIVERYPSIPVNADMQCDTDLGPQLDLESVFFEWTADTSPPVEETEVEPVVPAACGRQCPTKSRPLAEGPQRHVMIPPPGWPEDRLEEIRRREADE